jgi:xanthine/uracil permease
MRGAARSQRVWDLNTRCSFGLPSHFICITSKLFSSAKLSLTSWLPPLVSGCIVMSVSTKSILTGYHVGSSSLAPSRNPSIHSLALARAIFFTVFSSLKYARWTSFFVCLDLEPFSYTSSSPSFDLITAMVLFFVLLRWFPASLYPSISKFLRSITISASFVGAVVFIVLPLLIPTEFGRGLFGD